MPHKNVFLYALYKSLCLPSQRSPLWSSSCFATKPCRNGTATRRRKPSASATTPRAARAKLTVLSGSLTFAMMTEDGATTETRQFSPESQPPFIAPQQWHRIVSFSDDMICRLAFYCAPEDYYHKYEPTRTHSEVIEAAARIAPGKALDLGCGGGRNSLYLNLKGFDVTARDKHAPSIDRLNQIIDAEQLTRLRAPGCRISIPHHFSGEYDFILSTVVMMFLERQQIRLSCKTCRTAPCAAAIT